MGKRRILVGVSLGALLFLGGLVMVHYLGQPPESVPDVTVESKRGTPEQSGEKSPDPTEERSSERVISEVPSPPPVTGIAGTVLYRDSRLPAAGATVAAILDGTREHAKVTATGEDGHYILAGLEPGEYRLWCWKADWSMRMPDDWDEVTEVLASETVENVDRFLVPGVVIAGQVVEETTREPISGATVDFARLQFTRTGEDGRFRLEGVPTGEHLIAARAPRYTSNWTDVDAAQGEEPFVTLKLNPAGTIQGTVHGIDGQPAGGVQVSAGVGSTGGSATTDEKGRYRLDGIPLDARNIGIGASLHGTFATRTTLARFEPGETVATVDLELERGYVIKGRVFDPNGQPLEGVKIHLLGSLAYPKNYETDGEGRFVIEGASERMFSLTTRKKGFAPVSLELRKLSTEARENIQIALEPGHFVAGTVVDEEGNPVSEAWVYVEREMAAGGPPPSSRTDADGRFRIEDLPGELPGIGALKRGYVDNRRNPVEADRDDVRLVLKEAGQIQGVVVDAASGDAIRSLLVKVTFADGRFHEMNREKGFGGGLTASMGRRGLPFGNDDGSFRIRNGLAPGIFYKLIVQAESHSEKVLDGVEAWPLSEEREPIRIELERGKSLTGRVIAVPSGEALSGVKVSHVAGVSGRGGWGYWQDYSRGESRVVRVALTDADGDFVIQGLAEEPGALLLEKSGYARTAVFQVGPGADLQVFELAAASAIEGSVMKSSGEPLANVSVSVEINNQDFPGATTDSEGRYRIDGLPSGKADVEMRRHGSLKQHAAVETHAGEVAVVVFFASAGSIVGEVTLDGEPVAEVSVLVKKLANVKEQDWIGTDARGTFRVEGLAPGKYEVMCRRPGSVSFMDDVSRTVDVYDGETRCDISLTPSGKIRGIVIDRLSGAPVTGISLALYRHDPEFHAGSPMKSPIQWWPVGKQVLETGDNGDNRFEFDISKSGSYLIAAQGSEEKTIWGWLGPLELDSSGLPELLTVETGGPGSLAVTVQDAVTRKPIEGVWVSLRPAGDLPVQPYSTTDASGRAVVDSIPTGSYRLHLDREDHHRFVESVKIADGRLERAVLLKPATWLAVQLEGTAAQVQGLAVLAVVLSGDDPGWRFRSREDDLPVSSVTFEGKPARIKTRSGRYRIRFEVKDGPATNSPTMFTQEMEVVVAGEGDTAVTLRP